MKHLLTKITIPINHSVFLKDPEGSELGQRIIRCSIEMIDRIGFELFTFKKLGVAINSSEASIYRYFESKYKLLLYLSSWYWSWMEYQVAYNLANINSPEERLERAMHVITNPIRGEGNYSHINVVKLHKIVVSESPKAYLTRDVDKENKNGAFLGYKQLVNRISDIVLEINPTYKYPHMLISTVFEGAHHQRFFAEHLPRLTDVIKGEDAITEFYKDLVFKAIG